MKDIIQLNQSQILLGCIAGCLRQIENIRLGRVPAYGQDQAGGHWHHHIEGCLTEQALAIYLDLPWQGKGVFRGPDVGNDDVRSTRYADGRLIVHPEDADDLRIWLLTGEFGLYAIRGWIWGRDAKQKVFWSDPTRKKRWAFFVPQAVLHTQEKA